MASTTSGFALGAILAGSVFLYAGVKGVSVLKSVQAVIQGKSPTTVPQTQAVGGLDLSATTAADVTSSGGTAPNVAGNYNHAQLMQLWTAAGGSQATANNAACHAIQESGGRPNVTSRNPDSGTNVGLWQLDTPGGVGAGHSVAELQDPMTNARITVAATNGGTNWSQWATPGC